MTKIYGLYGITHGGAHVLSLSSPAGRAAVYERLAAFLEEDRSNADALLVRDGPGALVQCHEKTGDALARLVRACGVEVVSGERWQGLRQSAAVG